VLLFCGSLLAVGVASPRARQAQRPASANLPSSLPASWGVAFTDVAARAGLRDPVVYGGIDRKRFIIETNGSGVAFVDYDNDGWLDALTLNGTRLREGTREEMTYAPGSAPTNRLYRNMRNGTFEDATDAAGLRRTGWASSVCAGDYDNDGWTDLFLTYYGRNVLYRNRGGGSFEDATERAGLATPAVRWGSGCTFVDSDRDGRLDLFVANYLRFDLATAAEPGKGPNCLWKGIAVNCCITIEATEPLPMSRSRPGSRRSRGAIR
jgi:enediyne biosynthesis protein E4